MMTVEELQVLISANANQFKGELLSVKKELQSLNLTTNNVGKNMGGSLFGNLLKSNIIANVVTQTVGRLTNGFTGLISEVVSSGSALARLRIANASVTANMGMTSAQVQQLRTDLADANTYGIQAEQVISTLALSGLTKLAEGLSFVDGRSGQTKHGVTALTLAIKDLAASRGIQSDLGIEKVTKFIQRGEATFADGIIELSNLTDEYQAFANQTNRNVGQLSALEKANVRMNLVMREGAKAFGAYAATYNSSGKIFQSVGMLWRSITADFGSYLEPILRVGSLAFLEFARGIQESLFGAANSIQNFAIKVAGWMLAIVRIIGRLGQHLPFVGNAFKKLADLTLQPIKANGQLEDSVGGVNKGLDQTAKKAKEAQDALAGFDEMNVLTQPTAATGGSGGAGTPDIGVGGGGDMAGIADTTTAINEAATQAEATLKNLLKPVTDLINGFKDITIFGIPLVDILSNVAKWGGIAYLAFKVLSPVIGFITGNFGGFSAILKTILSPFGTLISNLFSVLPMMTSFKDVGAALSLIFTDVGVVIAGVAAVIALLVAGFISAWQQSEQFRNSVTETFNQVGAVFNQIVALFSEYIPQFMVIIQPLIDAIGNLLRGAFDLLGQIVIWVWNNALKPLADFILANIVPVLRVVLEVLKFVIEVFVSVTTTIINLVMPILTALWNIFTTVFNAIRDIVSWVWNNILYPIFKAFWDVLTGLVIPILQNLWNIFSYVFNALKEIAVRVWNGILDAIRPVINWIRDNIMPVINDVKQKFEGAFNSVKDTVVGIWESIKSVFKGGINGIIKFINGMIDKVNGFIDSVNEAGRKLPFGWSDITFRVGHIPELAAGGITLGDTVARIGEQGYQEAVLPLDRNTDWAEKVASLINNAGAKGNQTVVVKIGENTIYEGLVDYINDRSLISNTAILNI